MYVRAYVCVYGRYTPVELMKLTKEIQLNKIVLSLY